MGGKVKKLLLPLAGKPVFTYVLQLMELSPIIEGWVLVAPPGQLNIFYYLAVEKEKCKKLLKVVSGGARRQDSVWAGLQVLPSQTKVVLIHDGARPLARTEDIANVVEAARQWGSATLAVPVKDTIKEADVNDFVEQTLPREKIWLTQTPQAFTYQFLLEAYLWANKKGVRVTDDASLVEALGRKVKLVMGAYDNIKITTPEDIIIAEAILRKKELTYMPRVGMGFDVHRLVVNRPLVLGGAIVPFDKGCEGHSDADVLVHAIIDSLLGAAGAGDCGRHFPDTDYRYKDISSLILLKQTGQIIRNAGFSIENIDAVVVAQAPQLINHIPLMEENIASTLGIEKALINVKAKTTEGLGYCGRGEGIAAYATALLYVYKQGRCFKGDEK
jgi:2-C-methyl-D-erythritol 4-phosphate cytidylyltransferase/2-C-methyl-D-erythritol 2,4-cyclodiphosphate synthase